MKCPILIAMLALVLAACERPADGTASHHTIGLVTNNPNGLRNIAGFREEMRELGYVEGENATYVSLGTPVRGTALDAELRRLLDASVDLIFTAGTPTGVAAHRMTTGTDVPVVFGVMADPVSAGVLDDLTRPGGNLTGVMLSQNQARRLELFREMVPTARRLLVPFNPSDAAPRSAVAQLDAFAPQLGVELVKAGVADEEAARALLARLPPDVDGVFLVPDSTVNPLLQAVLRAARERKIPVSGPSTAQVEEGAFMTYGFVHAEAGAQAARMADQILKGTPPGDLPVQTAEIRLGINLRAAAALDIDVTDDMLDRAAIVIR